MAVAADGERADRIEIMAGGKDAVTQIAFGGGTHAGHRIGRGKQRALALVHVGRVHEAPVRIELDMGEQPLHRPHAAPGEAVLDFLALLGDVKVNRHSGVRGARVAHQGRKLLGCRGAQGMRRDTESRVLLSRHLVRGCAQQRVESFNVMQKATLACGRCGAAEVGVSVEHGQQCDGDAGIARRSEDALRHLGSIGIGSSLRIVMQVMEFGHAGVTRQQHFKIQLAGDRFHILGRETGEKAVHQLAPGPEIVAPAPACRQAGHGPLEGVRMRIRHAGNERAGDGFSFCRHDVGEDIRNHAVVADLDRDVARPAARQERVGGKEADHDSEGSNGTGRNAWKRPLAMTAFAASMSGAKKRSSW